MAALPPLVMIFLGAFAYALTVSKTRLRTAVYVLGSIAAIVGVGFVLTKVWPPGWEATIGTLTGVMCQIAGIAASIMEIRRSRKPPPAKSPDLP
jgi:hypothetical protein